MKLRFFGSLVLLLLILNINNVFAQGIPCDPDDLTCGPIDTWVVLLAVAFLLVATWQLYRKQKAQSAAINSFHRSKNT